MHKINIEHALKMCQELAVMQERLHRMGLHKTAHAMKDAVDSIGYEVAAHIEAQRKEPIT